MKNYVYVTAITNEKYILGLKALCKSMNSVETLFPLLILLPNTRFEELKSKIKCENFLDENDKCGNLQVIFLSESFDNIIFEIKNKTNKHWDETFFKLCSFCLLDYKKIILIDSDMMVLKNIDHLFELSEYSAANSGNAKLGCFNQLNSGLMIIKPNLSVFEQLVKLIPIVKESREQKALPFGDQDVLREFLTSWPDSKELHLDEGYNLYINHAKYYLKKNNKKYIYILHFVGSPKPFNMTKTQLIKALIKCNCFYMLRNYLKYIRLFSKK